MFNVGLVADFPVGSVTPVEAGRFYVVHLPDGGLFAVYRRCTHLGCAVPYDPSVGQFVCPCHGSAFTMAGEVLNAPAPRPLDLFTLTLNEAGEILVDTQTPIERDRISGACCLSHRELNPTGFRKTVRFDDTQGNPL